MPAERYFHPELLQENLSVELKEHEHHHLVHVMRTRLGETVEIVNGQGQLAEAVLESNDKKSATLAIKSLITQPPPDEQIILIQGIPKLNRLENIIEKGTELGMTEIWLFPAARSEKKEFSANQMERLQSLAISAMKQCGRLYLPKIVVLPPLKLWENPDLHPLFFGDVNPDAPPFLSAWKKSKPSGKTGFCIGPESGFTEEEIGLLKKMGAEGVKLNANILRTDTAAIACLVLVSQG